MPTESLNVRSIFDRAADLTSEAERTAYLDEACAAAPEIRQQVEALLNAHADAGSFLETPASGLGVRQNESSVAEGPGTFIGPYKLLQQIGEGGMGVVFMAEQTSPVQRKVALKIIKPGMDSRQVIARFEAERQALAMMDHPNIAKVLEAGTTESDRPYFVMELVKGVLITDYCDEHHLSLRERLELFLPVCQAVQHAHQKGIIHRDLKASNVLIALYDGRPVPKVIDFGVAKATGTKLTERTLFTEFGQVVGTLEYMSPEQAQLNQLDIDTRSDVYSLGVLLYELLTGTTPLERKRCKETAFLEVLRLIREEEPPKPSTRISTTEGLPSIAANRGLEPVKLNRLVRGELDWIVMTALEKDRTRRYETANGLATDVQRYLDGEAVHACPPSAAYRFRKLVWRHKVVLAAAAMLAAVLVIATVLSTWQAVRAIRAERLAQSRLEAETEARRDADAARQKAKAESQNAKTEAATARAVNDFLNLDLLGQLDPFLPYDRNNQSSGELKLVTVVDRAAEKLEGRFSDQPLVEAALRQTIGRTYNGLGDSSRALPHLRRALELRRAHLGEEHRLTLISMDFLGWAASDLDLITEAMEIRRRALGMDHPDTVVSMFNLAMVTRSKGDIARAIALFRETLAAARRGLGDDHPTTAWTMHCLAHTLVMNAGKPGIPEADDREIESMFRHALAVLRKAHGDSWHTFAVTHGLEQFLSSRHRYEEAEFVLQDALLRLQALPAAPPETTAALTGDLDGVYRSWGKPERAAEWERKRAATATQPR